MENNLNDDKKTNGNESYPDNDIEFKKELSLNTPNSFNFIECY